MTVVIMVLKYGLLFFGLYIQVFFLLTYLGWGKDKKLVSLDDIPESDLPSVGVIVPCFNEERGVCRTVDSLLAAQYPASKLQIVVVDDGSKDSTWAIVQKYKDNPQVSLYTKPNGGKFTALNFALERMNSDIIGCLDADSTIRPDAIQQSIQVFLADQETMCVVPAMTVEHPKTIVQLIQKVEFEVNLYVKKVFGLLGSIFVAPGPLTMFRKGVFEQLGPYRHGYLGEDLEIAIRMQFNHMKIGYSQDSHTYTHGMPTMKTLLKQRVRWTYSFFNNMYDYRTMILNPKYGHLGLFVIPITILGNAIALVWLPLLAYGLLGIFFNYVQPLLWGANPSSLVPHVSFFYFGTGALSLLGIITIVFGVGTILIGRSLNDQKLLSLDIISFFIYPFVSAWWTYKTLWKFIRSQQVTWR